VGAKSGSLTAQQCSSAATAKNPKIQKKEKADYKTPRNVYLDARARYAILMYSRD